MTSLNRYNADLYNKLLAKTSRSQLSISITVAFVICKRKIIEQSGYKLLTIKRR